MIEPSEQIKKVPDLFIDRHPVYDMLDYHETAARRELERVGKPIDLDTLMKLEKPSKTTKNLRAILYAAERVRECIKEQDAEGSARFMYRLTEAVIGADMALIATGRKGQTKDRQWLETAIHSAIEARKTTNCGLLWRFFKVNHNGVDNAMMLEAPVYGSVYYQNGSLIFDDNDTPDPITKSTFQKKLTKLKKNPS